jgi:hypothetical protein
MGRLTITATDINIITPITGTTVKYNVYNFIDEFGNVTQIKREEKTRIKYYPDVVSLQEMLYEPFVIGVSDDIPMGCGDVLSTSEMVYAIYE